MVCRGVLLVVRFPVETKRGGEVHRDKESSLPGIGDVLSSQRQTDSAAQP